MSFKRNTRKKKYAHLILENNIYMQEMKTKSSVINFNVPFFLIHGIPKNDPNLIIPPARMQKK